MSVRLKQRYSLFIIVLIVTLISFFIISKDKIEITVISEFDNPDDPEGGGAGPAQDPGDNQNVQIDSCEGVEEPVSDVRYISYLRPHCVLQWCEASLSDTVTPTGGLR